MCLMISRGMPPVKTGVPFFYMLPDPTQQKADMPQATHPAPLSPTQAGTRDKILQAARQLLEIHGAQGTQMMDVAKAAGIGRATLYRYYRTREQLVADLTQEWSREAARQLAGKALTGHTVGERLEAILRTILAEARKHPQLSQAALSSLIADHEHAAAIQEEVASLLPDVFAPIVQAMGTADFTRVIDAGHRLLLGTLAMPNNSKADMDNALKTLVFAMKRLIGEKAWNQICR
ncbi:MAG: TetR/AcrR family transcriptional regulator [Gammaproteobacteria bacterium]|nr:MAG: TetR/AcrR family transcriptional regulator [Gammaproteobacteria bacterium]